MGIQDSINNMIGTVGVAAAAGKHIKEQEIANNIAKSKEIGEINIAESELKQDEKSYKLLKNDLETAKQLNDSTNVGDIVAGPEGEERTVDLGDKQGLIENMEKAQSRLDEFVKAKNLQNYSFNKRKKELALRKELVGMKFGGKK